VGDEIWSESAGSACHSQTLVLEISVSLADDPIAEPKSEDEGGRGHTNTPTTVGGKLLSAAISVIGFVLLAITTAAVASLFVRQDEQPQERRAQAFEDEVLAELKNLRMEIDRLTAQRQS
jgi:hypothetical protein